MISFNLKCEHGHEFEGWFKDSASFEKQRTHNLLECAICGSNKVEKALSAPNISTSRSQEKSQQEVQRKLFNQARQELVKMRKEVESTHEDVGSRFAEEARKIHYGETEERGIYGNATSEEVTELNEEGIGVAALPWLDDKTN